MEMEPEKLFIGGISWDTSEERLKAYFETFGEVKEVFIMKDRITGRARGFGFVVFVDASVAEKVVKERHIIDGKTVEAKKAIPRDEHQNFNRNNGNGIQGTPGPARTKKIFVGGLASTITENDLKRYFDQFGTITDVVVMYNHNTQRPRGFGFITYDSEEAVEKVLFKTFHELNGKMVEVKQAVPKELSLSPTRNRSGVYNYGLKRVSNILNTYGQGYNSGSPSGYGMRIEGRFNPVSVGRTRYPPYSPSNYNMGLHSDFCLNYGNSTLSYGRGMNSYYTGNTNHFGSYDVGVAGEGLISNAANRNPWGDGSLNYGTNSMISNDFGSKNGTTGLGGSFGNIGEIWGSSPSTQGGGNSSLISGNFGIYGIGEGNFGGSAGYSTTNVGTTPSYSRGNDIRDRDLRNVCESESLYSGHTWRSPSPHLVGLAPYELGAATDTTPNNFVGYDDGYSVNARSNKGTVP